VISAKGFERDSYFETAKNIVGGLPKLEGTVHVNLALTLKFLPAYLFGSESVDSPPRRDDPADDAFLFAQGPTRGLSKIRFPDWRPVFDAFGQLPNVARFREQSETLCDLVQAAPLTESQLIDDLDFQQCLAQLFTLVPYGQLLLEQAQLDRTPNDVVEVIFEWLVRDFNTYAVELLGKASSTVEQQRWAVDAVRKPIIDGARDERIYTEVRALADAYVMPD
jgi:acyl-CoA dehydrogenase